MKACKYAGVPAANIAQYGLGAERTAAANLIGGIGPEISPSSLPRGFQQDMKINPPGRTV